MPPVRFAFVLLIACFLGIAVAQNPNPAEPPPRWTVLVDPVCPVSSLYARPSPNVSKDMRVLYFPAAKDAKLKDPESLELEMGFNFPSHGDTVSLPLAHNGDHWEAIVPLEKHHAAYAIFAIRDDKTDGVDDNSAQLWDVVFCDPVGRKDTNGVLHQAQSYTGVSWSPKLGRKKDYNRAVSILESYLQEPDSGKHASFLLPDLWNYKAERDGGDAQAYAKLSKEIDEYLSSHADDRSAASTAGNFVVRYQDRLPADFVERTVSTLDAKRNNPKHSYRAELAYTRAVKEDDPQKRLAALGDFVAKYPDSIQVEFAQLSRLSTFAELKDVAGAEAALASYRTASEQNKDLVDPNRHNVYLTMAQLYIDKGQKVDAALKLIDEAEESLKADPGPHGVRLPPEFKQQVDAQCAEMRARAYLALHQPDLALSPAEKAVSVLKERADAHFVLAQAYTGAGDKRGALDEYFEAALMPSNDDLKYRAELERYYRKNVGSAKQFQQELNKRIADRFQAAHYVPKLLDQPAPPLAFTTLKGETFGPTELRGKTLILNFWSPG